jgi:hypothetical protein
MSLKKRGLPYFPLKFVFCNASHSQKMLEKTKFQILISMNRQ